MHIATKWDHRFMALAEHIAQWSKDPSTKVGAVIVDKHRRVIGMGYNGFPRGVGDEPSRYADRPTKYKFVVHAEANAILNASVPVEDSTLYVTLAPCHECMKLIIQQGIKAIVSPPRQLGREDVVADTMIREAGIYHMCLPGGNLVPPNDLPSDVEPVRWGDTLRFAQLENGKG